MKRLLAFIALLPLLTAAQAQRSDDYTRILTESPYNNYVTFNISARYGIALPMGDQKAYIDRVSLTNLALDGEWLFPQRFSLGLKSGYQYSQQRLGRQVVTFSDGNAMQDVSAVQTRTLTIIPVMASLSYYFAENAAAIRPYIQMAGGGALMDFTNYYGTLADQQSGFKAAIAPAIGVKFYRGYEAGLGGEIQAQYQNVSFNYDPAKKSSPSLLLSAGIVYRFY